jgi:multicomponent K+:H+ antiporter subunit E
MMTRLIPHPLLSLTLILVWLGLVNTFTLAT